MAYKNKVPTASSADSDAPNVAPQGSKSPSADKSTPEGKSIFLFADGTGNSSAKLFKTNVWRMYEAVDLGLASPEKRVQIAYYDNGVGTSSFRPLRMLGGIFGFGLKLNVLRLYTFLCRNYQPNDRIYAFGFSRGAFTIRLLVGLITSQGVIRENKDGKDGALSYQVRDVYREFCADHWPNRRVARYFLGKFRAIRNRHLATKRTLMGQPQYCDISRIPTDVEFVGVWDTVAAYGGPFAEFTRGIDDWIWPLTMPHYGLSPKVLKARHALALDEERDAFHPLLWDEVREENLKAQGITVAADRLKQVWFTGVHSDVGGGYPDESLSYISLLWMMDEMSSNPDVPVDFVESFVQRAKDLANPFGPIHDSRSGVGAYYRYQPRKIVAMLHPPRPRTKSLRDPEVSRGLEEHGLLKKVLVHESAVARIISGIDDYAAAALPVGFEIVTATGPHAAPVLREKDHKVLGDAKSKDKRRDRLQENAWDFVWWRRMTYFATVAVTLVLVTLPLHQWLDPVEALCSDDRCFAGDIVKPITFAFPQSIREFLGQWFEKPLLLIILGVFIAILMGVGQRLERRFRGRIRWIWRTYLSNKLETEPATPLRNLRESRIYQSILFLAKWRILPLLFGWATLAVLAFAIAVLATQLLYAVVEPRQLFCSDRSDQAGKPSATTRFDTSDPCADLHVNVEKERLYAINVHVTDRWQDASLLADPTQGVLAVPWHLKSMAPLKRVISANWFAPLTEVRTHDVSPPWRKFLNPLLGPQIDIRTLTLVTSESPSIYRGLVCARRRGHLYFMVNDAAPLLTSPFYNNNIGSAWITVKPVAGGVGRCKPGQKLSEEETRILLQGVAS